MDFFEKINSQRSLIVAELYEWAETFIGEKDDEDEPTLEPYNTVFDLAKRLENNTCNNVDYNNIEFHIYQINYNEQKIKL